MGMPQFWSSGLTFDVGPAEDICAGLLAAEPHATGERKCELLLEAIRQARRDDTIWQAVHTSFGYFQREAGYTRTGSHSKRVNGRETGPWHEADLAVRLNLVAGKPGLQHPVRWARQQEHDVTTLQFPSRTAVGEVWWEDAREPNGSGHRLAISVVEVPDRTAVRLNVYTVDEVSVSDQAVGIFSGTPDGSGTVPAVQPRRQSRDEVTWRVTWKRGGRGGSVSRRGRVRLCV